MFDETVSQKPPLDQQENSPTEAGNSPDNQSQQELDACQEKVQELQDQLKYLTADFENYRRNAEKERSMWYIKAQGAVLLDLLSIVDDFDRAFEAAQKQIDEGKTDLAAWLKGFSFIREALGKILDKYDVKVIPTSGKFDPERHEALVQVESTEHASGEIVEVIRKGYLYKGAVLRTAQVTVAA